MDLTCLASMLMAPSETLGLLGGSAAAARLLLEARPALICSGCRLALLPLGMSAFLSGLSCRWPSIRLLTCTVHTPVT